ncbi:MAG TPA: DUF2934 domain-containing protein, partial [Polyangia bacterium]|nr:DUF2934 domain-containing protein [Polyangia bacterium]
ARRTEMAKSKSSGADARPSDEAISQRAYELYLQRGSVPGHETDDWLQAEAELMEARRNAEAAFAQSGKDQSSSSGEESPAAESSGEGRKTNGRRDGSGSGRRTLRQ